MKQNIIESLLEEKIGLDSAAIGKKVIENAVRQRMDRCCLTSLDAYVETLSKANGEWKNLIEMVVVPETWFFRNRKVFNYLVRFVKDFWLPENRGRMLRVLSIPCSTGEEPYSIAMAFMDAGIHKDRFHIDGIDISEEALIRARLGEYGLGSFRGKELEFRDRYFQPKNHGYQLLDHVREKVRFKAGNVLKNRFGTGAPFDVIFCRNLMIYMSSEARNRILETMSRLLAETGIFFCGHAERQTAIDWGFEAVHETGVFACRKRCRQFNGKSPSVSAKKAPFKRPLQEKKIKPIQKSVMPVDFPSGKSSEQQNRSEPAAGAETSREEVNIFLEAREMADQGQLPKALELCRLFLDENPVHAEAHFLMGLIYEALHNDDKAEGFFNKAIYLNPEHVEALNHLAFIESRRGNENGAERLRQRAQRISETWGKAKKGP
jgi:chemotaxis protein methyltransferase WspC